MTSIITTRRDSVAIVRLNRPGKLNALTRAMSGEMFRSLDEMVGAAALVVTGDEGAFCVGADLNDAEAEIVDTPSWLATINKLTEFPRPTVAAVEGWCLGGGLLIAAACDLRIAGRSARLGAPEARRGTFFGTGGTWRLPRLIGPARAKELLFTGEPVDADTALHWGLVNRVVPAGDALDAAADIARVAAHRWGAA